MEYASDNDIMRHSQVSADSLGLSDLEFGRLINEIRLAVQGFIDTYCGVPPNFFGLEKTYEKILDLKKFTRENKPILFLPAPITITSLQYNESPLGGDNWKTLAEGRDKDYVYDKERGIIYFCKYFNPGLQRIKITFKAGYTSPPNNIRTVTAELCSRLLTIINQRREGFLSTIGPIKIENVQILEIFTPELRELLTPYKQKLTL